MTGLIAVCEQIVTITAISWITGVGETPSEIIKLPVIDSIPSQVLTDGFSNLDSSCKCPNADAIYKLERPAHYSPAWRCDADLDVHFGRFARHYWGMSNCTVNALPPALVLVGPICSTTWLFAWPSSTVFYGYNMCYDSGVWLHYSFESVYGDHMCCDSAVHAVTM